MADVWGLVPTLTTTEALCLLAMHHIEDDRPHRPRVPSMNIADVWSIANLRRCTDDTGVQCWGCGRRGWRKDTEPDRWIEALCSAPDCLARTIAEGKP